MTIIKSKEVMKRNIKNDMERSIYLQMPPFWISSFVIFILFSLSHLNTQLAARISLISLFLLYCSQKKLFHFYCISSFKYLYGLCFRDIRWGDVGFPNNAHNAKYQILDICGTNIYLQLFINSSNTKLIQNIASVIRKFYVMKKISISS